MQKQNCNVSTVSQLASVCIFKIKSHSNLGKKGLKKDAHKKIVSGAVSKQKKGQIAYDEYYNPTCGPAPVFFDDLACKELKS